MTNGDKIRQMNDYHLAALLIEVSEQADLCHLTDGYDMCYDCENCILDWLRSGAKEREENDER